VFLVGHAKAFTFNVTSPSTTAYSYKGTCYANATDAFHSAIASFPLNAAGSGSGGAGVVYHDTLVSASLTGASVTFVHTGSGGGSGNVSETFALLPCDGTTGYSYPVNALLFALLLLVAVGGGYLAGNLSA